MPVSAEGRVEHQKLNQTAALLSFGWVFGVQLVSLEKIVFPFTRQLQKVLFSEYYPEKPTESTGKASTLDKILK